MCCFASTSGRFQGFQEARPQSVPSLEHTAHVAHVTHVFILSVLWCSHDSCSRVKIQAVSLLGWRPSLWIRDPSSSAYLTWTTAEGNGEVKGDKGVRRCKEHVQKACSSRFSSMSISFGVT